MYPTLTTSGYNVICLKSMHTCSRCEISEEGELIFKSDGISNSILSSASEIAQIFLNSHSNLLIYWIKCLASAEAESEKCFQGVLLEYRPTWTYMERCSFLLVPLLILSASLMIHEIGIVLQLNYRKIFPLSSITRDVWYCIIYPLVCLVLL